MGFCEEIYRKSADCKDLEPVPGDFLIKKTLLDILHGHHIDNKDAAPTRLIAWLYYNTRTLHCLFSSTFLQYFSYSWCIRAKK